MTLGYEGNEGCHGLAEKSVCHRLAVQHLAEAQCSTVSLVLNSTHLPPLKRMPAEDCNVQAQPCVPLGHTPAEAEG